MKTHLRKNLYQLAGEHNVDKCGQHREKGPACIVAKGGDFKK